MFLKSRLVKRKQATPIESSLNVIRTCGILCLYIQHNFCKNVLFGPGIHSEWHDQAYNLMYVTISWPLETICELSCASE